VPAAVGGGKDRGCGLHGVTPPGRGPRPGGLAALRGQVRFEFSALSGGQLFGALTFNATREERPWPVEIVNRLIVVAQVFASALARKAADQALRQSLAESSGSRTGSRPKATT